MKVEGIKSDDELKKAQASAQAQGASITNYNEWEQILRDFAENGIESTGSYTGDVAKMKEIQATVEEYVAEIEQQQKVQQNAPKNDENQKVENAAKTDSNQKIKETFANATSSQIMGDYMKYYHLLI